MHFILETPERPKSSANRRAVSSAAAASAWAVKIPQRLDKIPGTGAWVVQSSRPCKDNSIPHRQTRKVRGATSSDRGEVGQKQLANGVKYSASVATPRIYVNLFPSCLARHKVLPEALKFCQ